MTDTETTTCAHDMCDCEIDAALDHCSPTCRTGIGDNGNCVCGHANCSSSTGEASMT